MKIRKIHTFALMAIVVIGFSSCNNKKFHIDGQIADAKDSVLYLENMSLSGPVVADSAKLDADGAFHFQGKATDAPDFYRLRISGQIINLSIDSTETVTVKASYPTMASRYEVSGSENCAKIKELALMQQGLQLQINAIANTPTMGVEAVEDSVNRVLAAYKDHVKRQYIFREPMKAYSYFALFQTFTLGNMNSLVFNPRSSKDDVKVFAAVATSWDTYYPKAERGLNLHNIAIQGMKDVRLIEARQAGTAIDAGKVQVAGVIELGLTDNHGNTRRLADLAGKVVLLDFHLFQSPESTKRIMMLRDLYNKYHAAGFEIYQVSVDPDEHFWKTQTAALPWISVRDEGGVQGSSLSLYNVQAIPTFFLIGKDNAIKKRDIQVKDLDSEIKALL